MTSAVTSLIELRRFLRPDQLPPWHVHIVQRELNGGATSEAELEVLEQRTDATALTVSGLDQRVFETLARRFGRRLTALHLWKCPKISDLSPIEDMSRLTHLAVFWNQRAQRLWNFSRNPDLLALHFTDFTKLDQLDDIAGGAPSLRVLEFGNANFSRYQVKTLDPVGQLHDLTSLSFNAKTIGDNRIQPLANLRKLRDLDFPSNQFTVEQLAWLRARLPDTVAGLSLDAVRPLRQPLRRGSKQLDLLVNGRRMPFLSSTADATRVQKYIAAFQAMVEAFRADPGREPPSGAA
jgi:hypothetical protein